MEIVMLMGLIMANLYFRAGMNLAFGMNIAFLV
jgi:hypothetical protein